MTIIGFHSENVRKLSVVAFKPSPTGLVIISGRNGQGKTSVIDSIEMALGGADHIPNRPVRKGQDKATAEIDLGEYLVKRTVTADGGGSLIVRGKDMEKLSSPQQILDGLFNRLSFDPLEFARQKPDVRTGTLRELLGLAKPFKALDDEAKLVYDRRTEVNRITKNAETILKAKPQQEAPEEELSSNSILINQREAIATNRANAERRAGVQKLESEVKGVEGARQICVKDIEELDSEIKRLTQKRAERVIVLGQLEKKVKEKTEALNTAVAACDKFKDVDLEPFAKQLQDLEATNAKVRSNKERANVVKTHRANTQEADKLTARLDAIEREKRDLIAGAKWPIPGLGFNESNEVTFNGIPFDGCSTAEQLRISVAMGLALNPKLKVLLVRQGNDLDVDNLKLLGELAEQAGAQIWLERVDPSGHACVIIEDGHIAEVA